jgi:hypothetical protein
MKTQISILYRHRIKVKKGRETMADLALVLIAKF